MWNQSYKSNEEENELEDQQKPVDIVRTSDILGAAVRFLDAKKAKDKALSGYDGYEAGYYFAHEIDSVDEAEETFGSLLEIYIDQRIKNYISNNK